MTKANRQYKDNLFRYFFRKAKNFVQAYKELTGRDLDPNEIEFYDTSSLLVNKELRNDVSFITKDNRFVLLVEHQSTPCANMHVRLLLYYAEILKIYIQQHKLDVYGTKAISYPEAELYIAYNGKQEIEEKNFKVKMGDVTVHIKHKNIQFQHLANKKKSNTLAGYAYLVQQKEYYEKYENHTSASAMKMAVDDCKHQGFLQDYLERSEFIMITTEVWTIEKQMQDREEYGVRQGIEQGIEQARIETAKNLIEKGMPIEDISEVTQLPIDHLTIIT